MHAACPAPGDVRVFVFGDRPGSGYRVGRTLRSLRAQGIAAEDACDRSGAWLAERLAAEVSPVWLVRAGTWLGRHGPVVFPPRSDTGLPLCALGSVLPEPHALAAQEEAALWQRLQAETGGDFSAAADGPARLAPLASVFLETPIAAMLQSRLAQGEDLVDTLRAVICDTGRRVVRFPGLDVRFDAALRVAQVVTSLQRGGAERIVLDLHRSLGQCGIRSLVVTLGRPTRTTFPIPEQAADVSDKGSSRHDRIVAAAEAVLDFAADVAHGHLLSGKETASLAASGVPLLLTIHNARPGWPAGVAELRANDAALLAACAQAVEADLRASGVAIPVRTVWNGTDAAPFERTAALEAAAGQLRQQLGIEADAFVLAALANPRPQKRLERLPWILAATVAELASRKIDRQVRLVIAGEPSRGNEASERADAALQAAATECGLASHVHRVGTASDVAPLLAAADVLVSTSAYEGLSLAQLEALASGLPVVTTAVGGAAEIARDHPAMVLLPADASAERFAETLAQIAQRRPSQDRARSAIHFCRSTMAARYGRLYTRAIAAASGPKHGAGLWLVINNFSTGGAQSSARRLLLGLAAEGIRVRAAVLEEQADYPTPGRRALTAKGIPVLALPCSGTIDPAEAVAMLLERLDADPPHAILLWNAITEYKILLADSLLDVPVYDVSPGEMYFASLERYFQRPRPGLPYRTARDYGARLAGAVVKYRAEAPRAAEWLGAPVHVVPNGVPLDAVPAARCARERLVMGTAARISPQKKLEELLLALRQAGARLPPYVLRIAGGMEHGCEDYAKHLRGLADGLPVEWLGELEDPRAFLRNLDLFAMISEPAGCPNASLEAMAAGLPVVATDVGGASEQVEDGVTGQLTPPSDIEALADALVAQARDPELRARCGTAGRARIEARFQETRMVADYRRILWGDA